MTQGFQEKFEQIWKQTKILRPVDRKLFTFGDTHLPYILVADSVVNRGDTVVREGEVVVKRPLIYAPRSGFPTFEGFSEKGERAAGMIIQRMMYIPPYEYKNSQHSLSVTPEPLNGVVVRLNEKLDRKEDNLTVIIKTMADMWEVSVMCFAAERMIESIPSNLKELQERGFLEGGWRERER